jgi:cytochrome c-type biogenesis protein CcmH/NrfF
MGKDTAQLWIEVARFASTLGGVLGIILAGIGFIVRMTPPMDGTAIYWWRASAVVLLAGLAVGAVGAAISKWSDPSELA